MRYGKLFGNNIDINCEYCANGQRTADNIIICKVKREIVDGKCFRFKYNPLLRKPKTMPNLPKYDPKDFEL